ncbi:hypothetical protein QVG61_01750 [Thiohalobacter sp. IOR34]|uniref:hypothetical protein n=1 Tax=Thiohalobacter sp. IOR34 TaxID=3057176 RepID=UPI0025AF21B7|nr:hypothetical protein [Thiohalobacter sp. IOR34]WJW75838.1 hypothetical protein QVG61_01750 [Thiohalobacter sp. IOR34]
MKVVVVDAAHLPGAVDFPMLDMDRFGWEQYPQLEGEALRERCWRADVVVSLATPLTAADLEAMFKLRLVLVAGELPVDDEAAAARGIELVRLAGVDWARPDQAAVFCRDVVQAIEARLRG